MHAASRARRALLLAGATAALPAMTGCSAAAVQGMVDLPSARLAVQGLMTAALHNDGPWTLPQVLQHLAQSIEYSITGYPAPKSALFQHTAGAAAWAFFDARGRMTHGLNDPIPGAPALPPDASLAGGVQRLLAAIDRFAAHAGPLQPHFAYGALDKPAYTRAHLMHLANHWQAFRPA